MKTNLFRIDYKQALFLISSDLVRGVQARARAFSVSRLQPRVL